MYTPAADHATSIMISASVQYNRDRLFGTRLRRDSSIGGSNPYVPTNETDDTGTPVPTPTETSSDSTSSDVDVEAQTIQSELNELKDYVIYASIVLGLVFFIVIGGPLLKGLLWVSAELLEWLFGSSSGSKATTASEPPQQQ
jgi:hypothetical protein